MSNIKTGLIIVLLWVSTSVGALEVKTSVPKKEQPKTVPPELSLPDRKVESNGLTVIYGNSFVERLQEDGTFEAIMQSVHAGKNRAYRSLAYSGDEVGYRIRPDRFGDHLTYIAGQLPADQVLVCFGMNEAFAGEEGLVDFSKNLNTYISILKERHSGSSFFLVSPTAAENVDGGNYPAAEIRNQEIKLYCEALRKAAEQQGIYYIDLFNRSNQLYAASETPLTSNGLHLNKAGNQAIAKALAAALSSPERLENVDTTAPGFQSLREMVARKAYEVAMAYHPANGIHYYGVRSRSFEYATEIPHHLTLASLLDKAIWEQAEGIDTVRSFPELPVIQADPPPKPPRKGLGVIKSPAEDLADFEVAEGFEMNLFASSDEFPELINPLQVNFDARGRLWVSCFASYPVPVPGTLSNDKILIFEDSDGDGKADKRTVFADGLKLPDGFVLYKDGIVVSVSRKLIWLRDTDGDGRADAQEELLRGIDDTDTHHGGYLARSLQGHIIYNEGVFHRGQFETPHGPVRSKDATALYFDPVTSELTIQRQTTHPNPWKISFNRWGEAMQMFGGGQIIDCEYYNVGTPVGTSSSSSMGMPFRDDKGCALAFVSSPHFPEAWQGGLVTGHLLAKNTVLYTPLKIENGVYVKADESLSLLSSSNKSFRPADLAFGLDGALYISDFYYPIIGHAQHSIRDANRDYTNGRIWRVTRKGAALAKPPQLEGAGLATLFELLTHPQVLVRELVRLELERRSDKEVISFARSMLPAARDNEKLGLELMWLFERLKEFSNTDLLRRLIVSDDINVQRAAARSLRWWAPALGDEVKEMASELLRSSDVRIQIAILSVASYLVHEDHFWMMLIDGMDAPAGTPLAKVANLASLYDAPPLNPEFPLLNVAADTVLSGWKMNEDGSGGILWLKSDWRQELILGFRGNAFMNLNVNNIPLLRSTGSQHSKNGQMTVTLEPGINKIEFFSEKDGKKQKGIVDLYLAKLVGSKPDAITYAKDELEHTAWAAAYEGENATVTENRIYLKTVPAQMAYNVTRFTIKAGRTYTFILENTDHMLHNLVVTKPGMESMVGEMADAMAAQPDAMAKHYVPPTDMIIFSTPQIAHGEKLELEFKAPSEPGEYPFICTFPGHWRMMNGVMVVE